VAGRQALPALAGNPGRTVFEGVQNPVPQGNCLHAVVKIDRLSHEIVNNFTEKSRLSEELWFS